MIRCSFCKKNSKPGETTHRVTVEARKVTYEQPSNPNRKRTPNSFTEIVKEVVACTPCATTSKDITRVGNTLVTTTFF